MLLSFKRLFFVFFSLNVIWKLWNIHLFFPYLVFRLLNLLFLTCKEYEAEKKIPAGTIWKAIKVYGNKGSWPKLEIGELNADEFGKVFSEECSHVVSYYQVI